MKVRVMGFAALGAALGVSLLGSVGGVWLGGAIGALAGWALLLERRIHALESEVRERDARDAQSLREAGHLREAGGERADGGEPEAPVRGQGLRPPRVSIHEPRAWGAPVRRAGEAVEAAAPVAPRATAPAGVVERAIAAVGKWCTTGNLPVKVGVVLSIIGAAFLVKEAIDRGWVFVPLPVRLLGVALFGLVLLAIGWRLRRRRPAYALSVQGGGIAVLYLTTYAAFALYDLIPAPLAFLLLVAVTFAAGALAVLQDAYALAVLGIVGGFVAPVLTSDGAGNHVVLFSYYAILNAGIVGIAWFRAWRALNVLGFVCTFAIGAQWGYTGYSPMHFGSTEPFLVLFVLIYTAIPILFASRADPDIRGLVDGTLVFGTPIVGFGLQAQLVSGMDHALAWSAVAWAALYGSLAYATFTRGGDKLRVLAEAFFGLGTVFATLAVPLAFDARWTSAAWALEGAALVWLGWRQRRALALAAGMVLQGLAALAFARQPFAVADLPAFLNGYYLGAVMIAVAALVSARLLDLARGVAHARRVSIGAGLFVAWGTAWWLGAGLLEIDRVLPPAPILSAMLIFVAGTAALALVLGRRLQWRRIDAVGALLAPAMAVLVLSTTSIHGHPLASAGWLAWPIAFAVHLEVLRRTQGRFGRAGRLLVPLGFWVLAGLAAIEVHWWVGLIAGGVWPSAAALGAVAALVIATAALAALPGTLGRQATTYVATGAGGAALAAFAAMLALNLVSAGDAPPLPYVPVLNPLELASIAAVIAVMRWHAAARHRGAVTPSARVALAATMLAALYLLTMTVARTVHHWTGVPFDSAALSASDTYQAALSIVWGTAALAGMIVGARGSRFVWLSGAALMSVVVVKLFLVELDNSGTVERVVSFLGVGLLLLVVGYFAPVPPRTVAGRAPEQASA